MNRRQFLCLLPAAAVAGTATAAAPKSLSLEEGLESAWRVAPLSLLHNGQPLLCVSGERLRSLQIRVANYGSLIEWRTGRDVSYIAKDVRCLQTMNHLPLNPLWVETEQGPMRLCPHSLRWFPY